MPQLTEQQENASKLGVLLAELIDKKIQNQRLFIYIAQDFVREVNRRGLQIINGEVVRKEMPESEKAPCENWSFAQWLFICSIYDEALIKTNSAEAFVLVRSWLMLMKNLTESDRVFYISDITIEYLKGITTWGGERLWLSPYDKLMGYPVAVFRDGENVSS